MTAGIQKRSISTRLMRISCSLHPTCMYTASGGRRNAHTIFKTNFTSTLAPLRPLDSCAIATGTPSLMTFLGFGGKRNKSSQEVVSRAKEACESLASEGRSSQKAVEELSKHVNMMKSKLCGDQDESTMPTGGIGALVEEMVNKELLGDFCTKLSLVDFETRKDLVRVFGAILRHDSGSGNYLAAKYLAERPKLLEHLIDEYENPETALNAGAMLREALRHEALHEIILFSPYFSNFFRYIELPSFEVASDAFTTFRECLTRHRQLTARFLNDRHDEFFASYNRILRSENYVTRRQSVKLLGEILLDKVNSDAMLRYISDVHNLRLIMNLLKDSSRSIEFEAFHIFKVFVANPQKPPEVQEILWRNRDKLLRYLSDFQNDRGARLTHCLSSFLSSSTSNKFCRRPF